ncbi:Phosphoserine aminotransferase [Spirochaeta thermophila DSM 6578]|uniref:Phosphoserine aminotransferase n=1 Tax=Winmispira thermophila (strain ATCC 700085 / DSM 6578 / Z-1203) TaxID=869211 RepID=G0GC61_WINT7|nr:3-phosphoserine/phosphohydroxythreonine transaminase [Spirochaeta thermophila]AEJ60425.1 Phosphoserine aminotransferase [Spirochaeta thermophila DSM 6578]
MTGERVYNFSAGPSVLPEEVLKKASDEMLNYRGSGMSVMEMSHRSRIFEKIIGEAEERLRRLMDIPDDYAVLFLQGGASLQFAMVPMNLMGRTGRAGYIDTGHWSSRAIKEAGLFGEVEVLASSADRGYTYIPAMSPIPEGLSYVHITTNNTIYGTRYTSLPDTGDIPLVADASSNILSEPVDIRKFGIYYAGAQKNLGPAGVTVVIIRKDLAGGHLPKTPTMLRYDIHVEKRSLYNTPPCYAIYMVGLVLEWVEAQGGVQTIYAQNQEKAELLYWFLDQSDLFSTMVEPAYRSLTNVPFFLPSEELTQTFLKEAEAQGLVNLKGHRSVGGLRASIYNAMPKEGVEALVAFMKDFERRYGRRR